MSLLARLLAMVLLFGAVIPSVSAHEVRPASLQLREVEEGVFDVYWRQPARDNLRLSINPVLPTDCMTQAEPETYLPGDALEQRWQVSCSLDEGIISVDGLSGTLTDVLVDIAWADGKVLSRLLTPASPSLSVEDPSAPVPAWFMLGVEHLVFGIDHVLFVIGLVLLIRRKWMLLKTVTAFTVAHSITLAISTLGWVTLPSAPVEAVIALSILFVARELALPEEKRSRLTTASPWVMAFLFGLLHGFGFAGVVADLGLPRGDFAAALFLFNVGIEVGQLLIIALLFAFLWLVRQLGQRPLAETVLTYGMGAIAAYFTIDRLVLFI